MVAVNTNPAQGFYFFDPANMVHLPSLDSLSASGTTSATSYASAASATCGVVTASLGEDSNKKVRKPYTITKSRESWTEQEHDKFLEALQLFDRDWKKIEAFVGSKTVIQIRSHAQKYFLKVQKGGKGEHVPPPRPKRKASHPYPQKAPKALAIPRITGPNQSSSAIFESGYTFRPEPLSMHENHITNATLSSWDYHAVPPPQLNVTQVTKDGITGPNIAYNCHHSSNESTPKTSLTNETFDQGDQSVRVMPDFAQIYSFIGSVFDPNATGHVERLKQMDPINLETVLLLMQNLAINLTSPECDDHKKLLSSYDSDFERAKSSSLFHNPCVIRSDSAILSV